MRPGISREWERDHGNGGIEKATSFLRAVASKNPDLATRCIDPDRYVEHNPLAVDVALTLVEFSAGHHVKFGKIGMGRVVLTIKAGDHSHSVWYAPQNGTNICGYSRNTDETLWQ